MGATSCKEVAYMCDLEGRVWVGSALEAEVRSISMT